MSPNSPSLAIRLYGTDVSDTSEASLTLTAGPLSAVFDNGALRYISLGGVEVLRAVAFLVRDENWGTYQPHIDQLEVHEGEDGFRISYRARCERAGQALTYYARIEARPDGSLTFEGRALPHSDFLTARTGFVVLHPLRNVAGRPVRVTHTDGRIVDAEFPQKIDPVQPFLDVRALAHEVVPGVWATCRMEGDTFEMEDHRNWTDASFKTYVRPLARPWPYTLPAGVEVVQSVALGFEGTPAPQAAVRAARHIKVDIGGDSGATMPSIGVGVPAEEAAETLARVKQLKAVAPQLLVCQFDPRQGHDAALLKTYQKIAGGVGAQLVLEVVLPNVASPAQELDGVARAVAEARVKLAALAVSPAPDLKSVLPGSNGPFCHPLEDIYAAARRAFPGVPLGGGMFSFFTELNRKRPPSHLLDYVTHTTCPIVHAADDRSVMETLEALPFVIESARAIGGHAEYRVGPSSIGPRDNPHGAASSPNPDNGRVCLAKMDPRQRGLFGAAWILGYVAAFARGGAAAVTLGSATGPAGLIYRKTNYAQPWFDAQQGPSVYPAFHVVAGLARGAGQALLDAVSAQPHVVEVLAHRYGKRHRVWLANLTPESQRVEIGGIAPGRAVVRVLDATAFAAAAQNRVDFQTAARPLGPDSVVGLNAYAVACVEATV